MRDGQQAVISKKKNVVTMAAPHRTVVAGERGSFLVVISNNTKKTFIVSPSNVHAATFVSNDKQDRSKDSKQQADTGSDQPVTPAFEVARDGASYLTAYKRAFPEQQELRVYSYDKLVAEENQRAALQAVGLDLGSFGDSMAAANAGYQSGQGSFNTMNFHNGPTFGTYNYSSYNHAAAQAARNAAEAKASAQQAEATATHESTMRSLDTMLKEHTLMPGESYGGFVTMDLPNFGGSPISVPLVIDVVAGNEKHSFVYKITPSKAE